MNITSNTAKMKLGEEHEEGEVKEPKIINWDTKIDWESQDEEYTVPLYHTY
jgi:hypothetical protein